MSEETPKLTRAQMRERSGYWAVIAGSATIYLAPLVLLMLLLPKPASKFTAGIWRIQPGQTIASNEGATKLPENMLLLAVERLNGALAEEMIARPGQSAKMKSSDEKTIVAYLLQKADSGKGQKIAKDMEIAQKAGAKWTPSAGPWGLFLLPSDKAPGPNDIPFGVVALTEGMEKTRMDCESALNRAVFEVSQSKNWQGDARPDTVWKLLEAAVAERIMEPEEALEYLGQAQILQIGYIPEKNLFLSPQTVLNWSKLQKTLPKLGELPGAGRGRQ